MAIDKTVYRASGELTVLHTATNSVRFTGSGTAIRVVHNGDSATGTATPANYLGMNWHQEADEIGLASAGADGNYTIRAGTDAVFPLGRRVTDAIVELRAATASVSAAVELVEG